MSNRTMGGGQVNGGSAFGAGLSSATTGIKLTYTCPAGMQAEVTFWSVRPTGGSPTVTLQATIGGTTVLVQPMSASTISSASIMLNAGDSVSMNVTTAVAATIFDGLICAREFLAA